MGFLFPFSSMVRSAFLSAETARDADRRHINVEARLFCVGEAVGRLGQSRDANAGFSCC